MSSFLFIAPEALAAASSELTGIGAAIRDAATGGGAIDDVRCAVGIR